MFLSLFNKVITTAMWQKKGGLSFFPLLSGQNEEKEDV